MSYKSRRPLRVLVLAGTESHRRTSLASDGRTGRRPFRVPAGARELSSAAAPRESVIVNRVTAGASPSHRTSDNDLHDRETRTSQARFSAPPTLRRRPLRVPTTTLELSPASRAAKTRALHPASSRGPSTQLCWLSFTPLASASLARVHFMALTSRASQALTRVFPNVSNSPLGARGLNASDVEFMRSRNKVSESQSKSDESL